METLCHGAIAVKFNSIEITPETMQRTRQYFADLCDECVKAAAAGEFFVNDIVRYRQTNAEHKAAYLAGKSDHTFTFLQRAHYLQTGESVALLSR